MKQTISNYYAKKGFCTVYINTNKEPRRVATLKRNDGTLTSMSYAKYLYTSYYCCDVPKKEMIIRICPVCGKEFIFDSRNLSTHPNPCCSRKMWWWY